MIDDPIVASVRKVREELASAFNYDVHAIFAGMRNREAQLGDRLVHQRGVEKPRADMAASGVGADTAGEDSSAPATLTESR